MRLPGAGGAPEIATYAHEVLHHHEAVAAQLRAAARFPAPAPASSTAAARGRARASRGAARARSITDFGILRPDPATEELTLAALYPGVTVEAARAATGWPLQVADDAREAAAAADRTNLQVLRDLQARARAAAHSRRRAHPATRLLT